MSTSTSIGPGPGKGGNEDHGNADGLGNKTLGEHAMPEPEVGNEVTDDAAPDVPAGSPGAKPKPGIAKGPNSYPDGPNVEASPWELDAARGKLPE
ncbi:hypothetical protein [Ramlibacter albus]|uniref:Uncharacterized protein n=1 Tax=Ramlibacter albus TaxID=2079448 RepID=A0A923S1H2_9BURK|nr:hypothetical protein [Ramlibacter albus]MBC5764285.1 hypothetical protein [Ramlibacter albus]